MGLEGSVDCNGTCSSSSAIGCRIISHEEIERELDTILNPTFNEYCLNLYRRIKEFKIFKY